MKITCGGSRPLKIALHDSPPRSCRRPLAEAGGASSSGTSSTGTAPAAAGQTVPTAEPPGAAEDRQGRGPAQPHRLGGLPAARVGQAVRAADRMPGEREVRGQLGRDGRADEERRRRPVRHGVLLGRRRPAHPVRGRRPPGEHQPDPELEGILPRLPVPGVQHDQRRALRGLAAVGPERPDVQHQGLPDRPDVLERHLQPEVQGAGDRSRTTRSRSPTRRCTSRPPSRRWASPTRTS